MRITFLLLLVCSVNAAKAQIKTAGVPAQKLPPQVRFAGSLVQSLTWTDAEGQHFAVTSASGLRKTEDVEEASSFLYGYHFVKAADTFRVVFRMNDGIKDCVLDLTAEFVPRSLTVTDLDKNGTAEVWIMYRTACRGDVSPSDLKLLMYEGGRKHAMRGTSRIRVGEKELDGGTFTFDDAFLKSNAAFRAYAEAQWKKHGNEGS